MSASDFAKMKHLQEQIDELRAQIAALKAEPKRPILTLPNKDKAA